MLLLVARLDGGRPTFFVVCLLAVVTLVVVGMTAFPHLGPRPFLPKLQPGPVYLWVVLVPFASQVRTLPGVPPRLLDAVALRRLHLVVWRVVPLVVA